MKRPAQFMIERGAIRGGVAIMTGAELHHMRNVVRMRPGAPVTLIDDAGVAYQGTIRRFETDRAIIELARASRAARAMSRITLAAAIVKGARMDYLVEKAAELGASVLIPLIAERGVVREPGAARLDRWRRLAAAAAKQSLAPFAMRVGDPIAFADLIRSVPDGTLCLVLDEGAPPLGVSIRGAAPDALLMMCGPEGGFSANELADARAAGFAAAGLGSRRLRCETAALASLSVAAAALDEISQAAEG